jgi:PAS domain S-box-containing protein
MSESLQTEPTSAKRERTSHAELAESRLRELLANLPLAYITLNRDWEITYANDKAIHVNRQPRESFIGKHLWTVWPRLEGTEVAGQFLRAMEMRVPTRCEHYSAIYDAWFELTIKPIEEGIGVFYDDVTELRRARESVKQTERLHRAFTELNPQLILIADANGQVTDVSPRLLAYTGMTLEESCGEGWSAALHAEDEKRVLQTWTEALQRDSDFEVETRIRGGSDGCYRWFWVRGLPVRDEQHKTLYWFGVCIDINERKIAAEELRQSRKDAEHQRLELETMYRTAPIGLALFDPLEFRYLRLNDRQAEIVGLPVAEILDRTVTEIAPGIEGLRETFEQVARGVPVRNMLLEGELPMQPGVHRYWTVNYSPVYGQDGTVRAITAASLEITAQKRAELALIQSEKLAAVGRLASSISHEINNPLESITNLLYLAVVDEHLPAHIKTYLKTAQDELARVSQIATQSLRFHRQTMKPSRIGAADLMNSVLDLYQGRLSNLSIHAEAKYASTRRIACFENDIRQVLSNLIANAVDAMRRGGRLLLRTHDATDTKTGRTGVRFTIADTGHGMSPETRKRLFEAFYTTKELNGTGLGLWISRGIVARHKGYLSLRSSDRPDTCGTVFTLFLPDDADFSASDQP